MPGLSFVGGTQGAGEMRVFIIIPKLWSPSSTCPEMLFRTKAKTSGRLVDFVFFGGVLHKKNPTLLGDMKPRQPSALHQHSLKCKNQLLAQTFDC